LFLGKLPVRPRLSSRTRALRWSGGVDGSVRHPYKRAFTKPHTIMANTKSAKKAARQSVRRTAINKARRSRMRSAVRKVEEAIGAGDRSRALAAMAEAEPVIIRAAQKNVVHRNAARRKVSRLTHRIAALGKS
jgi:small subunit ribosomal protein S20